MSSSSTAQLSPRILSAYERLDTALVRLKQALDGQPPKVDARVVEDMQIQIETLAAQNKSLVSDLEQASSDDLESECNSLKEENDNLRISLETMSQEKQTLLDLNDDISERVTKLIGNVQQVLEEE